MLQEGLPAAELEGSVADSRHLRVGEAGGRGWRRQVGGGGGGQLKWLRWRQQLWLLAMLKAALTVVLPTQVSGAAVLAHNAIHVPAQQFHVFK